MNIRTSEETKRLVEKWSKTGLFDSGSLDKSEAILLESVPYQILDDGTTKPILDN